MNGPRLFLLTLLWILSGCVQKGEFFGGTSSIPVTRVSAISPAGLYHSSQQVEIKVSFGAAVAVDGTPAIQLSNGGRAYYSSGSGTEDLKFRYTVGAAEATTDLGYSDGTKLDLSLGKLYSAGGLVVPGALPPNGTGASLADTSAIRTGNPVKLAASSYTKTCVLISNGTVYCWGGQNTLFDDDWSTYTTAPVLIPGVTDAQDIYFGGDLLCFKKSDASIWCLGYAPGDGTGNVSRTTPFQVFGPEEGIRSVATTGGSACAILADRTVECWGYNWNGSLGDGTIIDKYSPQVVPGLANVQKLRSMSSSFCALLLDGTVTCWGYNGSGQLGDGTTTTSQVPKAVAGLSGITDLFAGVSGTSICARNAASQFWCWGSGAGGIAVPGATANVLTPTPVAALDSGTQKVAMGGYNACELRSNGSLNCWGNNLFGSNGNSTLVTSQGVTPIAGLTGVTDVSVGWNHVCAITSANLIKCWGPNSQGQLGRGTASGLAPETVAIGGVDKTAAGGWLNCVLKGGEVSCWGDNWWGQAGVAGLAWFSTPTKVGTINTAVDVASSWSRSCAVLANGSIECWGYFSGGAVPVAVVGIADAVAVVGGKSQFCAKKSDGSAACWGENQYGQLGDGTTNGSGNTAVPWEGGRTDVIEISMGSRHSCALLSPLGTVRCVGLNSKGQLGNGSQINSQTPVDVSGLTNVIQVASGGRAEFSGNSHNCALKNDGTVWCWGTNDQGQLGDGTTTLRTTPVQAAGVSGAISVAVGDFHSCALLAGGTMKCWGDGSSGQLEKSAPFADQHLPVTISGATDVAEIALGSYHTCVTDSLGDLRCWGEGDGGQLGDNFFLSTIAPGNVLFNQ